MTPREFAIDAVRRLQQAGFTAYWAGGCVRDELLGREPKDYDIATDARPEQVREVFGKKRTMNVGAAFGVVMVIGPKSAGSIEVATFRRDAQYSDGRHPDSVTFSDPADDARRRDFTINGMFFDPIAHQLIDYVGGRDDLQKEVVRAIGNPDHRISEDKLRMLRAVRFAAVFQYRLEDATLQAIRRHAHTITQVSAERITNELRLMFGHANRASAARLLVRSGLLPVLLPEAHSIVEWDIETGEGNANWQLVLSALAKLSGDDPAPAFALLLRPLHVAPEVTLDVSELGKRWRLSNSEKATIQFLYEHEQTAFEAMELPWSTVQKVLTAPQAPDLLLYCEAIADALGERPQSLLFCREKLALPPNVLDPPPLINGNRLKELGIPTGPHFKQLIDAIRKAQLDGEVTSETEAVALARELYDKIPKS